MTDARAGVNVGTGDRKAIPGFPGEYSGADVSDYWASQDLAAGETTYPRLMASGSTPALTSQRLKLSYFTALRTETITTIGVNCGNTAAAATPSLIRVGVWEADADGALLSLVGSTPNDTTLLAATFTRYTKALSASFSKRRGQRYAVGLLVVSAAAMPTVACCASGQSATSMGLTPKLAGYVAGQADLPATLAAGSVSIDANVPYFELLP